MAFHRKKIFSCGLFGLLFAIANGALAAHSCNDQGGSRDLADIVNCGHIVVAAPAANFPPFFFERDGKLIGIDIELAEGLGKSLGVEVHFNRTAQTFDEAVDQVVQGKADIVWSKLSRTMQRAKRVNFSKPYLSLNHALAINRVRLAEMMKSGADIAAISRDYKGTLGVLEGSSWMNYAQQNFPHAKLVQFKNYSDAIQAVRSGKVSALYRDNFEIKRLIKNDPTISLTVKTITFTDLEDTIGVAVRPDAHQLLAFINMYIEKQPDRLTVDKLLNHYESLLK